MSDLSRLLGDVYRSGPTTTETEEDAAVAEDGEEAAAPDAPATSLTAALPEWADEAVLDEAFSNWVPGSSSDAPVTERGMLADLAGTSRSGSLAEAVPDAPDFIFPQGDAEDTGQTASAVGRWQRNDDDLLPVRARARSWRRRYK